MTLPPMARSRAWRRSTAAINRWWSGRVISDCHPSKGASKNRIQIPTIHTLDLFSALSSLGGNRILPYGQGAGELLPPPGTAPAAARSNRRAQCVAAHRAGGIAPCRNRIPRGDGMCCERGGGRHAPTALPAHDVFWAGGGECQPQQPSAVCADGEAGASSKRFGRQARLALGVKVIRTSPCIFH
jgi:hypothetical protein